jgi:adenosylhomocysteine nucleosidase
MEREVAPLLKKMRRREPPPGTLNGASRRLAVFAGDLGVLVIGGIGAKAAGRAARMALELGPVDVLVSAGSAGALRPELKVGQVLRPSTIIDASTKNRFTSQGEKGTLVTYGEILGPEGKKDAAARFQADAVDMEAAGVARVAQEKGIAFLAIKSISDELDFALPPMNQFVGADGEFHTRRFVGYLAVRPWLWRTVGQMARDSQRASIALCEALESLEVDVRNAT